MDKKVYIIVVTYNGESWIKKCLDSIKSYSVIIVDNNSDDNTIPIIKEHDSNIVILEQKINLGFGKANNLGISYALQKGADYVFLLNQDAYLGNDCIKGLIKVHKDFQDYGILSPIHLNGHGNRLDKKFSVYLNFNIDFYSDHILNKMSERVYPIPFVNAAGWLISRDCLRKVGGFDPVFFHYGEDDNYCQRLLFHGFKIGVVPGLFLKHDRENRIPGQINKHDYYLKMSEQTVKKKYANINTAEVDNLKLLIKKRKNAKIKSLVKLNFEAYKLYGKEVILLQDLYPKIMESYNLNKSQDSEYLYLNV